MKRLLATHTVTWSKQDRYCAGQYANPEQPEEFPTVPVRTEIRKLPSPVSSLSFEKFNFDKGGERMNENLFETIEKSCGVLQLPFSAKEFAQLAEERALSAIYAHKNLAFIGPAGTGKTHLAKAFGYECCKHGLRTYFIKMSELRDKFTTARRTGKTASVLNSLVRLSCLIIDEVGHCEFDKENNRLFFDLVDRRYNKEGSFNIVFTSNKNPSEWRGNFNEDDALLCALDRIFDSATVITIKGNSFRGNECETISVQTTRVSAPVATDTSQQ